eukprot:4216827-Prymnesium_polylepis.1
MGAPLPLQSLLRLEHMVESHINGGDTGGMKGGSGDDGGAGAEGGWDGAAGGEGGEGGEGKGEGGRHMGTWTPALEHETGQSSNMTEVASNGVGGVNSIGQPTFCMTAAAADTVAIQIPWIPPKSTLSDNALKTSKTPEHVA